MSVRLLRSWAWRWAALVLFFACSGTVHAANCSYATGQGTTGPANWQTYCWIDFSTYNDVLARSAGGQAYALTLQDGSVMTFTMKVAGAAIAASTTPTGGGAAVGNVVGHAPRRPRSLGDRCYRSQRAAVLLPCAALQQVLWALK